MRSIILKYTWVVLLTFTTTLAALDMAYAKEMKKHKSSYMPVMVTESFEAVRERDVAEKPEVMSKHMALLEERYDLSGKTDPDAKMSGGKPLPVGPTAILSNGVSWESLGAMSPEEIKQKGVIPIPATATCQAYYQVEWSWRQCN